MPSNPAVTHVGKKFVWKRSKNGLSYADTQYQFFVSAETDFSGLFYSGFLENPVPFSGVAGEIVSINLQDHVNISNSYVWIPAVNEVTSNEVLRIELDRPGTAYAMNRETKSADLTLLIPEESLGTEYVLSSHSVGNDGSLMTIVATQDNTSINVVASGDLFFAPGKKDLRPAGTVVNIVLDQYEAFEFESQRPFDYTGSTISADKPFAVFGGLSCAIVPPTFISSCDHLLEQMPPLPSLGDVHVTVPFAIRKHGDQLRYISYTDNNQIKANGEIIATLDTGEFHETMVDEPSLIESTHPIVVGQYMTTQTWDRNIQYTEAPEYYEFGDASFVVIPPIDRYLTNYRFTTPALGFRENFISLVAPLEALETIYLDGSVVDSTLFSQVGTSDLYQTTLSVDAGNHRVHSLIPVGLISYGLDTFESYAFAGGYAFDKQVPITELVLTQINGVGAQLGDELCFDASVMAADNVGAEYTHVDFAVSGANTVSKRVVTDLDGVARFCYTGTLSGDDAVVASSGSVSDSLSTSWSLPSTNQPPVFLSSPDTLARKGGAHVYDIEVVDPEGSAVSLSIAGLPEGAVFDQAQNRITWVVPVDLYPPDGDGVNLIFSEDTIPVTVTATDAEGATTNQTYQIMIGVPTRLKPEITGLDRYGFVAGVLGQSKIQLAEGTYQDFYFQLEGEPSGMRYGALGTLDWNPTTNDVGSHTFTIIATNGTSNSAVYFEVTVEVRATNNAPVVAVTQGPYPLFTGQPFDLDLMVSDADGDDLTYTIDPRPVFELYRINPVIDEATGILTVTADPWIVPSYSVDFLFEVSDGYETTKGRATFKVREVNTAPVITSTPPLVASVGQLYQYYFEVTDPEQDPVTRTVVSGPAGMSFNDVFINWTPTGEQAGLIDVVLRAEDSLGAYSEQTFSIVVTVPNDSPVFTSDPVISAIAGTAYTYQAIATDADGDALEYALYQWPGGMIIDPATGLVSWLPNEFQLGEQTVQVGVSDGTETVVQEFIITVIPAPNELPQITSTPNVSAIIGQDYA